MSLFFYLLKKNIKIISIKALEDGERTVVEEAMEIQGWIYIGHFPRFPRDEWGYKNINIEEQVLPVVGKRYRVQKDINVRGSGPRFTFTGYKLGRIIGHLVAGQEIEIIGSVQEVGFSKVWAEVKLVNQ